MITKIKVEFATNLTKKLGTGPLKTVIYSGSYGPDTSIFGKLSSPRSNTDKNITKCVLVKKIEKKLVDDDIIDWEELQRLDHPNVARYIWIYERVNIFRPDSIFIIQNYCELTLTALIGGKEQTIKSTTLKAAIRQIASGLKYLHDKGIVHMNLKPSNILVKPPLSNPEGFVLTDYAYTHLRSYPTKCFCSCFSQGDTTNTAEIMKWMAPEVRKLPQPKTVTATGDNNSRSKECRIKSTADMFSFGKIIESMSEGCKSLDKVETILCKLLIRQMTASDAEKRINCDEILKKHPILIVESDPYSGGIAEARMDYIKDLYDKMNKKIKSDRKEEPRLRQKLEEDVSPVTKKFFPWTKNSFGRRITSEMNKKAREYDGKSLMHLLRLIRNTKEHPVEDKNLWNLRREVENDAFSKNFPYALPLIYVCAECPNNAKLLIDLLSKIVQG